MCNSRCQCNSSALLPVTLIPWSLLPSPLAFGSSVQGSDWCRDLHTLAITSGSPTLFLIAPRIPFPCPHPLPQSPHPCLVPCTSTFARSTPECSQSGGRTQSWSLTLVIPVIDGVFPCALLALAVCFCVDSPAHFTSHCPAHTFHSVPPPRCPSSMASAANRLLPRYHPSMRLLAPVPVPASVPVPPLRASAAVLHDEELW